MAENFGKDCNNVCNGTARNDTCGQCSNPPVDDPNNIESPFRDCNGDCFKGAIIDSCGNCTGGLTGKPFDFWRDACGKCVEHTDKHSMIGRLSTPPPPPFRCCGETTCIKLVDKNSSQSCIKVNSSPPK